jgi:hypothetical protein
MISTVSSCSDIGSSTSTDTGQSIISSNGDSNIASMQGQSGWSSIISSTSSGSSNDAVSSSTNSGIWALHLTDRPIAENFLHSDDGCMQRKK